MTVSQMLYPLVVADIALFSVHDAEYLQGSKSKKGKQLRVLLVQRSNRPALGAWALPGGLLQPERDASLEAAARRVLREKIGVEVPYLSEVRSFSGPDRDPRGWSIGMLYCALLPQNQVAAVVGRDVAAVRWAPVLDFDEPMAFDHAQQLQAALASLQTKVARHALPVHLLPEQFTLPALQATCEAILGHDLDKSVFRRRLKDSPDLLPLFLEYTGSVQRPALLYRARPGFVF